MALNPRRSNGLSVSCENTPFVWFTRPSAHCQSSHPIGDRLRLTLTSAATIGPRDPQTSEQAARGARDRWDFVTVKGFDHGMAMRVDRKDAPDRPPGQPLQPQNQTAVFAQSPQCDAYLGRAQPFGAFADFGKRAEIGRSPRRARRLPACREGRRPLAAGARDQATSCQKAPGFSLTVFISLRCEKFAAPTVGPSRWTCRRTRRFARGARR